MATSDRSNGALRDFATALPPARIRVVGAGGGGSNAVNRMIEADVKGVEFICVNTDVQALERSLAPTKVRLGEKLTRGLGAGGKPDIGAKAAEESSDELHALLKDSDMVFITAGMGGGTGTGSIPVIAQIAQEVNALTVAVVTKPFTFEGPTRRRIAEEGINNLKDHVDTLITIPNDRLLQIVEKKTTMDAAFRLVDDILRQGIQGISELITVPGLINLDFADVKTIMSNSGSALMAIGRGSGENRAVEAARAAVSSPLLDVSIDGAKGVLFNITGSPDLSLMEVSDAAEVIAKAADPDANIIFGAVIDPNLNGEVKITVIATGFEQKASLASSRAAFGQAATPLRAEPRRFEPERERERERPEGGERPGPTPLKVRDVQIPSFQADDTDIPAFLRRR